MAEWFENFKADFILNFIEADRWKALLSGLGVTMKITCGALVIGIVIGAILAMIRSTYDKNEESYKKNGGASYVIMKLLNAIAKIYLTVIRGTPSVVQLMIAYFVIFAWSNNGVAIAVFAFGINSGAYVAEIIRGGIMAVDNGQFEAGRSLGFNYIQTMMYIIIPQVFKSVLPALLNEFIVLIKETSVAGYVGVVDLTKAGDMIRGRTFSAFMPLIAVALIYLALVLILTKIFEKVERSLRRDERTYHRSQKSEEALS